MKLIKVIDFGIRDYDEMLRIQRFIFNKMTHHVKNNELKYGYLLLTEHYPVITLGRFANRSNLLVSENYLKKNNIKIERIERGGDITFHGPGQLVVYPMINLKEFNLTVKGYVYILEESIIRLLSLYGIKGERKEGAPGVWVSQKEGNPHKICALGVKCSKFCTMHGLALNINTNIDYFRLINPCGFTDCGVTSMLLEKGGKEEIKTDQVKSLFSDIFLRLIFSL